MKLNQKQLRSLIESILLEATGGDGYFERVNDQNWQHLEVGNLYVCKSGRSHTRATFVDWVTKDGQSAPPDLEDPNLVDLKFADESDGMEWEAYWFEDGYAVGSSADPLYVKEE